LILVVIRLVRRSYKNVSLNDLLDDPVDSLLDSLICFIHCEKSIRLDLQLIPHPKPYKLQWINEDGELTVDTRVKVPLSVGNYKDEILCDVVPTEACHILLGRP